MHELLSANDLIKNVSENNHRASIECIRVALTTYQIHLTIFSSGKLSKTLTPIDEQEAKRKVHNDIRRGKRTNIEKKQRSKEEKSKFFITKRYWRRKRNRSKQREIPQCDAIIRKMRGAE
ncbi:hypothetical protein SDJN03_26147, partial [Cucurbita argyrosperma subsp. sororia]